MAGINTAATMKPWETQLNAVELAMNRVFRAGSQIRDVGFSLVVNGTIMGAFLKQLGQGAAGWDFWRTKAVTALEQTGALTANATGNMQQFGDAVDKVGSAVGVFSPEQIANAWYFFASALDASDKSAQSLGSQMQAMDAILKATAIGVGANGPVSPQLAAQGIAQILTEFKLPLTQMQQVKDANGVMTEQIVNNATHVAQAFQLMETVSNVTFPDLLNYFKMVGPAASAFGATFDQMTALYGVLSGAGTKGTSAGRAEQTLFRSLEVPKAKALGDLDQIANAITGTTEGWNKFVQSEDVGTASVVNDNKGIVSVMEQVSKVMANVSDAEKGRIFAAITSANGLRVVLPILQQGADTVFTKYLKDISNVNDLNTFAQANWKKFSQTVGISFDMATFKVKEFANELGIAIMQAVIPMVNAINPIIDAIRNWAAANPDLFKGLTSLVVVMTTLLVVVGAGLLIFGQLVDTFALLKVVAVAFPGLLGEISSGIVGALISIAPLIAIVYALYAAWKTNFDGIRATVETVVAALSQSFEGLFQAMTDFMKIMEDIFNVDWSKLNTDVKDAFASIGASIVIALNDALGAIIDWFIKLGEHILQTIDGIFPGAQVAGHNLIVSLVNGMIDAVDSVLNPALTSIGNVVAGFFEGHSPPRVGPLRGIQDWGHNLIAAWSDGVMSAQDKVKKAAHFIAQTMSVPLEGHSPAISGPLAEIDAWGENLASAFLDGMKNGDFAPLKNLTQKIADYLNPDKGGPLSNLSASAKKVIDQFMKEFKAGFDQFAAPLNSAIANIASELDNLSAAFNTAMEPLKDALYGVEAQIKSIDEKYAALIAPLNDQKMALQEISDTWQQNIDKINESIKAIEETKLKYQAVIESNKLLVENLQATLNPYEDQKNALKDINSLQQYQIDLITAQQDAIKNNVSALEFQNKSLDRQAAPLNEANATLKDQKATLQDSVDNLNDQNTLAGIQLRILQDQDQAIKDKYQSAQDSLKGLLLQSQNPELKAIDITSTAGQEEVQQRRSTMRTQDFAKWLQFQMSMSSTQVDSAIASNVAQESAIKSQQSVIAEQQDVFKTQMITLDEQTRVNNDQLRIIDAAKRANSDTINTLNYQIDVLAQQKVQYQNVISANDLQTKFLDTQELATKEQIRAIEENSKAQQLIIDTITASEGSLKDQLRLAEDQKSVIDAQIKAIDYQVKLLENQRTRDEEALKLKKQYLEDEIAAAQHVYDLKKRALDDQKLSLEAILKTATDEYNLAKKTIADEISAANTVAAIKKSSKGSAAAAAIPGLGAAASQAAVATGTVDHNMASISDKASGLVDKFNKIKQAFLDIMSGKPISNIESVPRRGDEGRALVGDSGLPPIMYKIQEWANTIRPIITNLRIDFQNFFVALKSGSAGDAGTPFLNLAIILHQFGEAVKTTVNTISHLNLGGALGRISGDIKAIFAVIRGYFSGDKDAFGDPVVAGKAIATLLHDAFASAFEFLKSMVASGNPIKEFIEGLFKKANIDPTTPGSLIAGILFKAFQLGIMILANLLPMLAGPVNKAFDKTIDYIVSHLGELHQKISKGFHNAFGAMEGEFPILKTLGKFVDGFNKFAQKIEGFILPMLKGHGAEIIGALAILDSPVGKLALGFLGGMVDVFGKLAGIAGGAIAGIGKIGGALLDAGKGAAGLITSIGGGGAGIGGFASSLMTIAPFILAIAGAFLAFKNDTLGINEQLKDLVNVFQQIGANKDVQDVFKTVGGAIKDLLGALMGLLTMGVALVLENIMKVMRGLGQAFQESAPELMSAFGNIKDALHSMEPAFKVVLGVLGIFINVIGEIVKILAVGIFKGIVDIIVTLAAVFKFLAPILNTVLVAIGTLVGGGLSLLMSVLTALEPTLISIVSAATILFSALFAIGGIISFLVFGIGGLIGGFVSFLVSTGAAISAAFEPLLFAITEIETLGDVVTVISALISGAFTSIVSAVATFIGSITLSSVSVPAAITLIAATFSNLPAKISYIFESIKNTITGFISSIKIDPAALISSFVGGFESLKSTVSSKINDLKGVFSNLLGNTIGTTLSTLGESLGHSLDKGFNNLLAAWETFKKNLHTTVDNIVASVIDYFTVTLPNGIVNFVKTGILDPIKKFFQDFYDAMVGHSIIPDLVNGIITWLTVTLPNGLLSLIQDMLDTIGQKWTDFATSLGNIVGDWNQDGRGFLGNMGGKVRWMVTNFPFIIGQLIVKLKLVWDDFAKYFHDMLGDWNVDGYGMLGHAGAQVRSWIADFQSLTQSLHDTLSGYWQAFSDKFNGFFGDWFVDDSGLLGGAGKRFRSFVASFKSETQSLHDTISSAWQMFSDKVTGIFGSWDDGTGMVGGIKSALLALAHGASNTVADIVNAIGQSIVGAINGVLDAARSAANFLHVGGIVPGDVSWTDVVPRFAQGGIGMGIAGENGPEFVSGEITTAGSTRAFMDSLISLADQFVSLPSMFGAMTHILSQRLDILIDIQREMLKEIRGLSSTYLESSNNMIRAMSNQGSGLILIQKDIRDLTNAEISDLESRLRLARDRENSRRSH